MKSTNLLLVATVLLVAVACDNDRLSDSQSEKVGYCIPLLAMSDNPSVAELSLQITEHVGERADDDSVRAGIVRAAGDPLALTQNLIDECSQILNW